MKKDKSLFLNKSKSDSRVLINVTLLGICFTLFTLIITIKPELLQKNLNLTLQLVSAIPLFMASSFARSKLGYTKDANKWNNFGFTTFLIAYSFLINVVGILLISLTSILVGLIYFSVNIATSIGYSMTDIAYDRKRLTERIVKDLAFILIIIFLGILPNF
ncbi:MAG TPA: hypothetical protein VJH20_04905 [Candidatus Nanoarchaeia archaeon]|nr:hypothetical protein [Candidatus Nanoarchaeia archaeon]